MDIAFWTKGRCGKSLGLVLLFAAATLCHGQQSGCLLAPTNLVGWWPGDGSAVDVAGTNHGTLLGGATATAAGLVSTGFSFDGTNGFVTIPDAPELRPTNLTVEAWVRFDGLNSAVVGGAPAGLQYLVFKKNSRTSSFEGFSLVKVRSGTNDIFSFGVSSSAGVLVQAQSTTTIKTSIWYHVAGVRGTNFIQLYVNGQLQGQATVSFPQDYSASPMCLASSGQSSWDGKLKGMLDEVSLYQRPLSSNEIADIYAAGANGKCRGPSGVVITGQPQSQTALTGSSASFAVTATGAPQPGFQWLFNGTAIPGAATNSLTITNLQTNSAGNYTVLVSNSSSAVTSQVAVLTVVAPAPVVAGPADALVLVNSQSPRYVDFQRRLQPYLDNFGIPYSVLDLASNPNYTNWFGHALLIIGHSQLDTNKVYLSTAAQGDIVSAVGSGVGLVNFDPFLFTSTNAPIYQFTQGIFNFAPDTGTNAGSVTFPATEPGSRMHFVTSRHSPNETLTLTGSMNVAGLIPPADATSVAQAGGKPFVVVRKYGNGRVVQWASFDWVPVSVQGPLSGLDDLVWRGLVWAARKPFVMRGLPNFVTMRVDDITGPMTWEHTAIEYGFKPFLAVFIDSISPSNTADLRNMIINGQATACAHSFTGSEEIFFDHAHLAPYSASALSNTFARANFWLTNNGIPPSKIMATHNSEMGTNAFGLLTNWGVEFFPIEVQPGQIEYYTNPPAPWLMAGPYRLYDPPGLGESTLPLYYADFLSVPGHPEFNGRYFNVYTEIRNVNPATQSWFEGGDWGPTTNVASSIAHGTAQLKRALDSQVLATVFSHENYVSAISNATWRAILQGVTSNIASYNPIYVTLDFADQYVRATRTSRLLTTYYDPSAGQLTATFSGHTDLPTGVFTYTGEDDTITNVFSMIPVFSSGLTTAVATVPPIPWPPAAPSVTGTQSSGGAVVLTWNSTPGLIYTLQTASNLYNPYWSNVAPAQVATSASLATTNLADSDQRFYRVVMSVPPW